MVDKFVIENLNQEHLPCLLGHDLLLHVTLFVSCVALLPLPSDNMHAKPPCDGEGELQPRDFMRSPPPHVTLQALYSHSPQLPWTERMKGKRIKSN